MSEMTSHTLSPTNDLIGSYFLQLWRRTSQTLTSESDFEEEVEESPTALDTINSFGGFAVVGPDKLSISYPSVSSRGHDVGAVQANCPAPSKRLLYYFEIYVKNAGAKGKIAIGFTTSAFKLCYQPGWEKNSYGYHGDDGRLFCGDGWGKTFGPTYTVGDTVGGGINNATQELFFTKNGTVIGSTCNCVNGPLFPTVAVHSQSEEVTVNFGKDPFVFDLTAYEAEQRAKERVTIDSVSKQQALDACYGIVQSYLQHYGYEETLKLFENADISSVPSISFVRENGFNEEDSVNGLNQRRTLRQLIRCGEIDETFSKLYEWYPQIVQDDTSTICFLLHCQKFIELIRDGKLLEAVRYGQSEFGKFKRLSEFDDLVQDCTALLAYERPCESPTGYLLQESHRELVADAVNALILSANANVKDARFCMHSNLEILIRQLTVCSLEVRSLNWGMGEPFHLDKILKKGC